ncbi:MAG: phage holin family protein [Opitutaceae bacterium]|jgi:uncharacterized membrane protein YqjE
MDANGSAAPGFLGTLRHLGDSLISGLQDRMALIAIELHEEKFRLIQIFFWVSAILSAGLMAITFASLTLVYLFWDSFRLEVLGGLALLYSVAFGWIVVSFRRYLRRQPRLLASTLQEFASDRSCIRKRS